MLEGRSASAIYAISRPSCPETLNSFAILRLSASWADKMPLISVMEAEECAILDEITDWIAEAGDLNDCEESQPRRLTIGGPGRPWRHELYWMTEEDEAFGTEERTSERSRRRRKTQPEAVGLWQNPSAGCSGNLA